MENVITIAVTVVSGVLVYLLGEMLQTIWLTPLQKYKSIKHDIAVALSFYAREYANVIDIANEDEKRVQKYSEVSTKLRALSCELTGFIETLSWFKFGIPSKKRLTEAAKLLMGLSNSLFSPYNVSPTTQECRDNSILANEILTLLGMYGAKKERRKTKCSKNKS